MTLIDSHSIIPQIVRLPKPTKHRAVSNEEAIHSVPGKRFTVRDGFHLHDRNQELKERIDRGLFPPPETRDDLETNHTIQETVSGPSVQQLPVEQTSKSSALLEQPRLEASSSNANDRVTRITSILEKITLVQDTKEPESKRPPSNRSEASSIRVDNAISFTTADTFPLDSSAEWLIYRQRQDGVSQWHQVKMEKLLHDTLQHEERQQSIPSDNKKATITCPPRPRHQSTLGSTYGERVAASRRIHHSNRSHPQQHTLTTETERCLTHSREASNKDVDRLLLSLFQSTNTQTSVEGHSIHSSTPFSTRRSDLREQTAAALKSRKLRSRVDELRSLPELISKIEAIQRLKQQQLIEEHGEDLVQKNRKLARLSVIHRPGEAAILPSVIDQKLQLASKRKKELDEAQESAVRNAVSRWQKRRLQYQELQRKRFCESQWLLIVALAESNTKWLRAFHLFKKKRDALNKVLMAKRIQHYWRQQSLIRQNSLAVLSFTPMTPITSPFYRMPLVMNAIQLVQRFIRRWLESRRFLERRYAIAIIVTSWFEFQDVKFRRLILRFRKRVRDFQVMWREWRAITEARVKLLLLVWTRLEKKAKRRHGLMSPHSDGGNAQLVPMTPRPPSQIETRTVTLVEYFRAVANRGDSGHGPKAPKEQKRLEGVHRHLRNGGTVQSPIASVATAGIGPAGSTIVSGASIPVLTLSNTSSASQPSPPSKQEPPAAPKLVKRNMKLVQNMGEEFQLAMYDYYTTAKSPKSGHKSPNGKKKRARSPRQSPNKQEAAISSPSRSLSTNSPSQYESKPPVLALMNGSQKNEKVSIQLKTHLLRQLLSEKRRLFRELKEKKREQWKADRQHKRRVEFRYNVLDELAAFQRFQAENKVFLLLHSVSDGEMMRLIQHAQQLANEAAGLVSSAVFIRPPSQSAATAFRGRRSSSNLSVPQSSSLSVPEAVAVSSKAHSIIAVGSARLERFDDEEDSVE